MMYIYTCTPLVQFEKMSIIDNNDNNRGQQC